MVGQLLGLSAVLSCGFAIGIRHMRYALFALLCVPVPAYAYQDITKVAVELGNIIGSETACGYITSPDAVSAYVAANVDPSEMAFASGLYLSAAGTAAQISGMTPSGKAAHCTAVKRSAIHFKLVK